MPEGGGPSMEEMLKTARDPIRTSHAETQGRTAFESQQPSSQEQIDSWKEKLIVKQKDDELRISTPDGNAHFTAINEGGELYISTKLVDTTGNRISTDMPRYGDMFQTAVSAFENSGKPVNRVIGDWGGDGNSNLSAFVNSVGEQIGQPGLTIDQLYQQQRNIPEDVLNRAALSAPTGRLAERSGFRAPVVNVDRGGVQVVFQKDDVPLPSASQPVEPDLSALRQELIQMQSHDSDQPSVPEHITESPPISEEDGDDEFNLGGRKKEKDISIRSGHGSVFGNLYSDDGERVLHLDFVGVDNKGAGSGGSLIAAFFAEGVKEGADKLTAEAISVEGLSPVGRVDSGVKYTYEGEDIDYEKARSILEQEGNGNVHIELEVDLSNPEIQQKLPLMQKIADRALKNGSIQVESIPVVEEDVSSQILSRLSNLGGVSEAKQAPTAQLPEAEITKPDIMAWDDLPPGYRRAFASSNPGLSSEQLAKKYISEMSVPAASQPAPAEQPKPLTPELSKPQATRIDLSKNDPENPVEIVPENWQGKVVMEIGPDSGIFQLQRMLDSDPEEMKNTALILVEPEGSTTLDKVVDRLAEKYGNVTLVKGGGIETLGLMNKPIDLIDMNNVLTQPGATIDINALTDLAKEKLLPGGTFTVRETNTPDVQGVPTESQIESALSKIGQSEVVTDVKDPRFEQLSRMASDGSYLIQVRKPEVEQPKPEQPQLEDKADKPDVPTLTDLKSGRMKPKDEALLGGLLSPDTSKPAQSPEARRAADQQSEDLLRSLLEANGPRAEREPEPSEQDIAFGQSVAALDTVIAKYRENISLYGHTQGPDRDGLLGKIKEFLTNGDIPILYLPESEVRDLGDEDMPPRFLASKDAIVVVEEEKYGGNPFTTDMPDLSIHSAGRAYFQAEILNINNASELTDNMRRQVDEASAHLLDLVPVVSSYERGQLEKIDSRVVPVDSAKLIPLLAEPDRKLLEDKAAASQGKPITDVGEQLALPEVAQPSPEIVISIPNIDNRKGMTPILAHQITEAMERAKKILTADPSAHVKLLPGGDGEPEDQQAPYEITYDSDSHQIVLSRAGTDANAEGRQWLAPVEDLGQSEIIDFLNPFAGLLTDSRGGGESGGTETAAQTTQPITGKDLEDLYHLYEYQTDLAIQTASNSHRRFEQRKAEEAAALADSPSEPTKPSVPRQSGGGRTLSRRDLIKEAESAQARSFEQQRERVPENEGFWARRDREAKERVQDVINNPQDYPNDGSPTRGWTPSAPEPQPTYTPPPTQEKGPSLLRRLWEANQRSHDRALGLSDEYMKGLPSDEAREEARQRAREQIEAHRQAKIDAANRRRADEELRKSAQEAATRVSELRDRYRGAPGYESDYVQERLEALRNPHLDPYNRQKLQGQISDALGEASYQAGKRRKREERDRQWAEAARQRDANADNQRQQQGDQQPRQGDRRDRQSEPEEQQPETEQAPRRGRWGSLFGAIGNALTGGGTRNDTENDTDENDSDSPSWSSSTDDTDRDATASGAPSVSQPQQKPETPQPIDYGGYDFNEDAPEPEQSRNPQRIQPVSAPQASPQSPSPQVEPPYELDKELFRTANPPESDKLTLIKNAYGQQTDRYEAAREEGDDRRAAAIEDTIKALEQSAMKEMERIRSQKESEDNN
jgi:hypothetical protein